MAVKINKLWQTMSKKELPIDFDKTSVKMMLHILDKYEEVAPLGSPVEKKLFCNIYRKLKIALFELSFME